MMKVGMKTNRCTKRFASEEFSALGFESFEIEKIVDKQFNAVVLL